jgi:catechol 2,3-dioxygenase-like lactoylglutathione lyase family enzyme
MVALGVADIDRSIVFYRGGLGLPLYDHKEGQDHAMFALEGAWLFLYPREALAEDAGVPSQGSGFRGVTLAHNASSKAVRRGSGGRGPTGQVAAGRVLGRLQRLFRRSGRAPVGSSLQSLHRSGVTSPLGGQALEARGLAADMLGPAEQLAIEPYALEPVVEA